MIVFAVVGICWTLCAFGLALLLFAGLLYDGIERRRAVNRVIRETRRSLVDA